MTYQWYSDASPILGETTKVYEVEFDTIDTNITCVETAINAFGSDSATSNSLGPVVPPNGAIQTRAGALLQGRNGQLIINDQHGLKLTGLIIQILVEDGASNPRSLTASDIAYIGYWQLVSSVRQTVGSVEITAPVDVDPSDPWVNSGISNDPAGTLKIRLPYAAAVGDPDAIEIEITPVSGTVVIPSPIVAV